MSRKTRSRQRNVTTKRVVTIGARLPNKDELSSLLNWFLPDAGIFSKLKFHGNTKWAPNNLVCLALCWAWSDSRNITDAFTEAAEWYETLLGVSALKTYHGFMNAMVTWSSTLVQVLVLVLQKRIKEVGGRFWRIHGWVPIAFDGSRATAPR